MKRILCSESSDTIEDTMYKQLDECKDTFDYVISGVEHLIAVNQIDDAQAVISSIDDILTRLVDDVAVRTVE